MGKGQQAIHEHMEQAPLILDMETISILINNLINQDQHQLRLELERRKTMLRLNVEEHRLVEKFYELKQRQTEINSAKIIWKAINEQQNIIHEIAIFKKWLEVHAQESSYTLNGIQLPNIYHIFITLSFEGQTSSVKHITEQTIAKAEEIVEHYSKIAKSEQNKLQSTKSHHKNPDLLEQIIHTILQRENNLEQRRAYELQGKITNIFNYKRNTQMDS
ncbi:unnamed protein product [Rotaria sordida]|uniref:Uncharacterized protein n=1 Tax=Rotaria sordida TaxID=392033 RepID=A0A816C3L7_9BILA|nr:unnamed protein product [Rotaria sordida]CAF1615411.1 unnamed protein product [Rotaria sordida]